RWRRGDRLQRRDPHRRRAHALRRLRQAGDAEARPLVGAGDLPAARGADGVAGVHGVGGGLVQTGAPTLALKQAQASLPKPSVWQLEVTLVCWLPGFLYEIGPGSVPFSTQSARYRKAVSNKAFETRAPER